MQLNWRAISGPALTTATALLAFLVDRHFVPVPNPAPLFVCIVALTASVSGIVSGLASAVIAVTASALFFLNHRAAPGYDPSDLARMLLLAATAGGTALITGLLRQKWVDALAWEKKHHATADRLSAALDHVGIGIVLLNFRYPRRIHQPRLPRLFRAIRRAGRQQAALHRADVSRPRHRRLATAGGRTERVHRQAHRNDPDFLSTPLNINLADGQVLRFICTALPDGGRMLSYTPVTDLVRHNDDPDSGNYVRALRGSHRSLAQQLGAAE